MIAYGTLVVFVTPKGRRYIKKLEEGRDWHSQDGILRAADVAASDFGGMARTSGGVPIRIDEASLADRIMGIKRQTQIIYPKDIAYICLRLGAGAGRVIAEAGCGSGGLTLALSWFCGPDGKVISHDIREEFTRLARRNLDWANLGGNVELHCRDIADGFAVEGADALFLDVREPWLYLTQAAAAVKKGAQLAFLLPTAPQLSQLLLALEDSPFGEVEVCEIFLRQWKPNADRLRPQDRMTAHTGFLVFCRQRQALPEFERWLPRDTRERKQDAAKMARLARTGLDLAKSGDAFSTDAQDGD